MLFVFVLFLLIVMGLFKDEMDVSFNNNAVANVF